MAFQIPFNTHSRASLIKALVLFMRSSSSWPNHPRSGLPMLWCWALTFNIWIAGGKTQAFRSQHPPLDARLLRCSAPFHCQTSWKSCRHFHFPTLVHPWDMPSLPVHITFHVAKSSHFSALVLLCFCSFCSVQPCWPVFPAQDAFLVCRLEHHAPLVFLLPSSLTFLLSSFIRSFSWRTFAGFTFFAWPINVDGVFLEIFFSTLSR